MSYLYEHLGSTFFYSLILIFSVLFAFLAQIVKSKSVGNILVTFVTLTLALPAGLRDVSVGIDTPNYFLIINSADKFYIGELYYTYYEIGFQWVIKSLISILKDPHYVLMVIALVTITLIVRTLWFFRDRISFSLSVFLYVCMQYFSSYNTSRQWLAIAISFFATRYLFDGKYLKFSILVLVSSLFHGSALICLLFIPLHMLMVKKITLKYKIFTILLLVTFTLFNNYILDILGVTSTLEKYQYYLDGGSQTNGIGIMFIIRLLAIVTAIWLLVTNRYKFKDKNFIKTIIALYILGLFSMFLGYLFIFAVRLGAYANIYGIILFSMIAKSPFAVLIKPTVVLIGLYLFFSGLSNSSQGHMPYKVFFDF